MGSLESVAGTAAGAGSELLPAVVATGTGAVTAGTLALLLVASDEKAMKTTKVGCRIPPLHKSERRARELRVRHKLVRRAEDNWGHKQCGRSQSRRVVHGARGVRGAVRGVPARAAQARPTRRGQLGPQAVWASHSAQPVTRPRSVHTKCRSCEFLLAVRPMGEAAPPKGVCCGAMIYVSNIARGGSSRAAARSQRLPP